MGGNTCKYGRHEASSTGAFELYVWGTDSFAELWISRRRRQSPGNDGPRRGELTSDRSAWCMKVSDAAASARPRGCPRAPGTTRSVRHETPHLRSAPSLVTTRPDAVRSESNPASTARRAPRSRGGSSRPRHAQVGRALAEKVKNSARTHAYDRWRVPEGRDRRPV